MKIAYVLTAVVLITKICCALKWLGLLNLKRIKIGRIYQRNPRIPTTPDRRWELRPIGHIISPYIQKFEAPRQATISRGSGDAVIGGIQLFPEYYDCLKSLEDFDYIWLISLMHLNNGYKSRIKPQPREPNPSVSRVPSEVGLFSTRSPHRPNPIALSALQITNIDHENGLIEVYGLDLLNDTPVLDIKPYIPAFDSFPTARSGWMDNITPIPDIGRELGYQSISSPRGLRQARAESKNGNQTSVTSRTLLKANNTELDQHDAPG